MSILPLKSPILLNKKLTEYCPIMPPRYRSSKLCELVHSSGSPSVTLMFLTFRSLTFPQECVHIIGSVRCKKPGGWHVGHPWRQAGECQRVSVGVVGGGEWRGRRLTGSITSGRTTEWDNGAKGEKDNQGKGLGGKRGLV